MPRRPRTPPQRIESGLLSADQLRLESERWESLVHRYVNQYSEQQKPQITAIVRDWCFDVARCCSSSGPAPIGEKRRTAAINGHTHRFN